MAKQVMWIGGQRIYLPLRLTRPVWSDRKTIVDDRGSTVLVMMPDMVLPATSLIAVFQLAYSQHEMMKQAGELVKVSEEALQIVDAELPERELHRFNEFSEAVQKMRVLLEDLIAKGVWVKETDTGGDGNGE